MDVMDIQPPKRRPPTSSRPARPVIAPQPRPKISLESVRQIRQTAQYTPQARQQDPPPNYVPHAPSFEPVAAVAESVEQTPAREQAPIYQPEPEAVPAVIAAPKKRHKKKHRRLVLIIFVVILLGAAGAAVGFLYLRNQQPQYVSARFVSDLQSDNPQAGYGLVSDAFRATTTETILARLFKQVTTGLQGPFTVSDKLLPTKADPSDAIFVYKITTANGARYIRVVLQKNTKWQVQNFRSSDTVLTAQEAD